MGQMITKPDANPIISALANWIFLNGGIGYFLMGQKKKAIIALIICWVVGPITCGVGMMCAWVFAYDAYLLSQKLQAGQSIGENENGLEFLNMIFKD
ncbi:hypothetical protein LBMAG42_29970 [Deltaproteobacteria bacterium]|nr:hypothetical protein LBMAG42_29970 [Deltaproteobacteria bacterium]